MLEQLIHWIVGLVEAMGYAGVFICAMLESTFVPLACEVTLIPAGYLISQGKWNGPVVFCLSIAGTLTGSLLNYWIARGLGRQVLEKHQKLFFMNEAKLKKMDDYFEKHGPISIFLGRLVFGVRHFISFPAGLARMDQRKFVAYTFSGSAIWTAMLLVLGYEIGNNQELAHRLMPEIKIGTLVVVALIAFIYWQRHKRTSAPAKAGESQASL